MLTAEINETYASTAITLLGNISYRLKRELRFRSGATQRFTGDEEANAMITGTISRAVHRARAGLTASVAAYTSSFHGAR